MAESQGGYDADARNRHEAARRFIRLGHSPDFIVELPCCRPDRPPGQSQQGAGELAGMVQQDGVERANATMKNWYPVRNGQGPLLRSCPQLSRNFPARLVQQAQLPSVRRDGDEHEAGEGSARGSVSAQGETCVQRWRNEAK